MDLTVDRPHRPLVGHLQGRDRKRGHLRGRPDPRGLPRGAGREPHLTFNPGLILGGTDVQRDKAQHRGAAFGKTNVIPATARGRRGTCGPSPTSSSQGPRADAAHRGAPSAGDVRRDRVSPTAIRPCPRPPGNQALLDRAERGQPRPGRSRPRAPRPRPPRGAGTSRSSRPTCAGLAGLGLPGSGAHTPEETADLSALPLPDQARRALIYRLTR